MKIMRRLVSSVLICCMLLSLSPVPAAAEEGTTHTLVSGDLLALMNSEQVKDGDTIVLSGTCYVNDLASNSAPWVIGKAVAIRGGIIDLRAGGILLGADVTFDNVVLSFANRVRNVIAANGYCLTLKDVSEGSGTRQVHLFCGGMSGYAAEKGAGSHGQIVIQGSTSLGNLYAGSIFTGTGNAIWENNASVIVDNSANGTMGDLYACGAVETPVGDNWFDGEEPAPPAASTAYSVTGTVTINLYQGVVKTVNGNTDGTNKASVIFNGNGDLAALALQNIKDLSVETGNLLPAEGSSMSGNLAVASGAILDVANFGDSLSVENFIGGGTLVLGENQTLTITGAVSGETSVGIGTLNMGVFYGALQYDTPYIQTNNVSETYFQLLPYANDPDIAFQVDANGNWMVPEPENYPVIVESAEMGNHVTVESGISSVSVPIPVVYASNGFLDALADIMMFVSVNGKMATTSLDDSGYLYTVQGIVSYFTINDDGFDAFVLCAEGVGTIPDGKYVIEITIPASHMASGEALTLTTVLTVGEEESESPGIVASGSCNENLTWYLTADGTLTIRGEGAMVKQYSYPWDDYREQITSVVIESGVTGIGNSVFSSFSNLTSVTLPSGLTSIGYAAFRSCKSLTSISIPASVTEIGAQAFECCFQLESITVEAGNQNYCSVDGVLFNKEKTTLIFYPVGKEGTEYEIPAGVTRLESYAFYWSGISVFVIPTDVVSIGDYALPYSSIGMIYYGGTQEQWNAIEIGNNSALNYASILYNCTPGDIVQSGPCGDAAAFTLAADGTLTVTGTGTIRNDMFSSFSDLQLVVSPRVVVVSEGITDIGRNAFSIGSSVTTVSLPTTLRTIGANAFGQCANIASIEIPSGVTSIGASAFASCYSLRSITIPAGVTRIEEYTFSSCRSLESVTLPATVTSIELGAFQYCSSLPDITIPGSVTNIAAGVFPGCGNLRQITVDGSNLNYCDVDGVLYDKQKTQLVACPAGKTGAFTIPDSVTRIEEEAFYGCGELTDITIPEGVTSIGEWTFRYCSGLTEITIPEGVTSIGEWAFHACSGLTDITIPGSVTNLSLSAFDGCDNLERIAVAEDSQTYCDVDGILYDKELTRLLLCPEGKTGVVAIPNSVTSIGDSAFSGCSGLTSIAIPNSVTSIDDSAFSGCSGLTSIAIPNSVTSIGESAFSGCSGLTSIAIPNSVTSIGYSAFFCCSGLTSIVIPNSVTSIGYGVFLFCSGLTSVAIPATVTSIAPWAFDSPVETVYYSGTADQWEVLVSGGEGYEPLTSAEIVYVTDYGTFGGNVTWMLHTDGSIVISGTGAMKDYDSENAAPWHDFRGQITEIIIEDGVTHIGDYAFYGCAATPSTRTAAQVDVTIGRDVTSVGTNAFSGCTALGTVIFTGNAPEIAATAFPEGTVLYYSSGASGWGAVAGAEAMAAPTVTVYPADMSAVVGERVIFTASFAGSPAPTLQWQISMDNGASWTDIPGATETTYTINSVRSTLHGAQFRCVAINAAGTVVSSPATLTLSGIGITAEKTVVENGISVTVHVGNLLTDPKSGEIFCAVYGSSGKMLGIAVADVTVAADSESMVTLHIACDASLVHGVRVFFLGGMIPLCAAANS